MEEPLAEVEFDHKQPAWDVGDLANGALRERGPIIVSDLLGLMKNEYPVADNDLVLIVTIVNRSSRLST